MKGLECTESPQTNLAYKPSLSAESTLGYAVRLGKHFSLNAAVGAGRYSWKYRSDVTLDHPNLPHHQVDVRYTPAIYCPMLQVSVEKEILLRQSQLLINGGIALIRAPSLFQANSLSFQDSFKNTANVFTTDFDFNHEIIPMLFLKFGFPFFNPDSRLSVFLKLNYGLQTIGRGRIDFTNITTNSHGVAAINLTGINFELRCRLL